MLSLNIVDPMFSLLLSTYILGWGYGYGYGTWDLDSGLSIIAIEYLVSFEFRTAISNLGLVLLLTFLIFLIKVFLLKVSLGQLISR